MHTASIAQIVEHGGWRVGCAERFVVGDVDPTSGDIGLARGQDGAGRVVAMEPLG